MRRKRVFRRMHAVTSAPSTTQAVESRAGMANEEAEEHDSRGDLNTMAQPRELTESSADATRASAGSTEDTISAYNADVTRESTASSRLITAPSSVALLMAEVRTPLQAFERLQVLYSELPSAPSQAQEVMREQITALSAFLGSVLAQSEVSGGGSTQVTPSTAAGVLSVVKPHSDAMSITGSAPPPHPSSAEPLGYVSDEGPIPSTAAQPSMLDTHTAPNAPVSDIGATAASLDYQLQPELEALVGEVVEEAVLGALAQQRESFTTTLSAVLERSHALERALNKAHAAAQRAWAPLPAALPTAPPRGVPRPAAALMGDVGLTTVLATAHAVRDVQSSEMRSRRQREVHEETAFWDACARLAGLGKPSSDDGALTGDPLAALTARETSDSEVSRVTARLERCTSAVEQAFIAIAAEDSSAPPRILDVLRVARAAATACTTALTTLTSETARVQQARVRVTAKLREGGVGAERLALRREEASVTGEERLLLHGAQVLHRTLARVATAVDGGLRGCLWMPELETVFGGITTVDGGGQSSQAYDANEATLPLSVDATADNGVDGTGACAWHSAAEDIAHWRRWCGAVSSCAPEDNRGETGAILGEREAALFAACAALSRAPVLVSIIAQVAARALRGACAEPQRTRATGLWTTGVVLRTAAHHWVACPRVPIIAPPRATLGGTQRITLDLPPAPGGGWLSELAALVCEAARTACSDGAVVTARTPSVGSLSAHTLAAGCSDYVWRGLAQLVAAAAVEVQGGVLGGSVLLRRLEAGMGVRAEDWLGAAPEAVTEGGDEAAWTSAWATGAALAQEAIASVEAEGEGAAGIDRWSEAEADALWSKEVWGCAAAGGWKEFSDPTHLCRETVWWSRGEAEGYQHYLRWHGGSRPKEREGTGANTTSSSSSSSSAAGAETNTSLFEAVSGSDEPELCVRPRVRRAKGVLPSAMDAALSQLAKQDW